MKTLVYLEINTFKAHDPSARHYYGQLKCHFTSIELKRKLTKVTAEILNAQKKNWEFGYRAGQYTNCFDTRLDVRKFALKTWRKHFPKSDVLIEGRSSILDPQYCIDGNRTLKAKINALYHKALKIGGYEGNEKEMEKISDKFLELIEWGKK